MTDNGPTDFNFFVFFHLAPNNARHRPDNYVINHDVIPNWSSSKFTRSSARGLLANLWGSITDIQASVINQTTFSLEPSCCLFNILCSVLTLKFNIWAAFSGPKSGTHWYLIITRDNGITCDMRWHWSVIVPVIFIGGVITQGIWGRKPLVESRGVAPVGVTEAVCRQWGHCLQILTAETRVSV